MASRVSSTRLIGRASELAELESTLRAAGDGHPSIAFVAGESGVGKTRLVNELAHRAKELDARTMCGDCVELGEGELLELYDDAYARETFVELRDGPVGVIDVRDSNYCRISLYQDPRNGRVIVFAAIDNLWKGAASQAVQNLNLMFGFNEAEGIR